MKPLPLKYKRLTVIKNTLRSATRSERKRWFVDVRCDCGIRKTINAEDFLYKKIKSCGCLHKERSTEVIQKVNKQYKYNGQYPGIIHGDSGTRFHVIWKGMNQRCYNKKSAKYPRYGGRGISIEWPDYNSFKKNMYKSYLSSINKSGESNTTINRTDNNGNYSKENCNWVSLKEQANNTSKNKLITYNKRTLSVTQWSRELGIPRSTINSRIHTQKLTDPNDILKK